MKSVLRSIGIVLLGLLVSVIIIFALEHLGHLMFPLPPDINVHDPSALKAALARMPIGALLSVLAAWCFGTLAGSWLAARLAHTSPCWHAAIVGAFVFAAAAANMVALPHPVWFAITSALAIPLSTAIGCALARHGGQFGRA